MGDHSSQELPSAISRTECHTPAQAMGDHSSQELPSAISRTECHTDHVRLNLPRLAKFPGYMSLTQRWFVELGIRKCNLHMGSEMRVTADPVSISMVIGCN